MFFGEYDYATDVAVQREEAREEGIAIGEEHGRTEGIVQGERRKALETARILKASGIDGVLIAESTGLTQEEIAGL